MKFSKLMLALSLLIVPGTSIKANNFDTNFNTILNGATAVTASASAFYGLYKLYKSSNGKFNWNLDKKGERNKGLWYLFGLPTALISLNFVEKKFEILKKIVEGVRYDIRAKEFYENLDRRLEQLGIHHI